VVKYRVSPITAAERPRCTNCGVGLTPYTETVYLRLRGAEVDSHFAAIAEEEFNTNQRVIRRIVETVMVTDAAYNPVGKKPWRVRLSVMPQPVRWGIDGLFCTGTCAQTYGRWAAREIKSGALVKRRSAS
jgi:hypothetical protein